MPRSIYLVSSLITSMFKIKNVERNYHIRELYLYNTHFAFAYIYEMFIGQKPEHKNLPPMNTQQTPISFIKCFFSQQHIDHTTETLITLLVF